MAIVIQAFSHGQADPTNAKTAPSREARGGMFGDDGSGQFIAARADSYCVRQDISAVLRVSAAGTGWQLANIKPIR